MTDLALQGVDLRLYTMAGAPVPALFDAPTAIAMVQGSGPWGTLDSPARFFGVEPPPTSAEETFRWWSGYLDLLAAPLEVAGAVFRRAVAVGRSPQDAARQAGAPLEGIEVPAQITDPALVGRYLADQLTAEGQRQDWPRQDVRRFVTWMRAVPPGPTVVQTVDQIVAHGPPAEWPGSAAWYGIALQLRNAALRLAAAQGLQLIKSTPGAAVEAYKRGIRRATPMLQRIRSWAQRALGGLQKVARQIGASVRAAGLGIQTGTEGLALGAGLVAGAWAGDRLAVRLRGPRGKPTPLGTLMAWGAGGAVGFGLVRVLTVGARERRQTQPTPGEPTTPRRQR